ncbi:MAG TPA: hypothetical protein VJG32_02355 [Anaerolineae bacterium]|nr:hypothetical protein [Anaerolineae bacterium]
MIAYIRRIIPHPSAFILIYLLITVVALNNLIANFSTALPGVVSIQASNEIQPSEFDIFLWDIWWVRHAVFDLHVSPLYTNYVVYPFTSPLAGHTLVLLWGFISAPFQLLFGLLPTFNGIIVFDFVAAAFLMYLFARRRVRQASVAWLAGLIFAFTPAMLHRASLGHLDKLSTFWLPLVLLLWDKVSESRRWTWAVILGLCLYLSWLTDFQQAMWAMLLLVPYAIFGTRTNTENTDSTIRSASFRGHTAPANTARPVRREAPGARRRGGCRCPRPTHLIPLAALALAAFILPSLFAPLPQLLEAGRLNYPAADLQHAAHFAFAPGYFFAPDANGDFSIGVLLPLLSLVSIPFIRRDGRRWLWLGIAVLCFVLALGPYIDIGSTRLPLPYTLVHALLGNQYRTPMRFATPGVLALAMLVALTLDSLISSRRRESRHLESRHLESRRRESRRRESPPTLSNSKLPAFIIVLLSLLFILDYQLLRPFPITRMPDYQAYRAIAAAPGDFTLLDIPIGVRTGFAVVGRGEYLQYYQPIHQRPIPGGYLSRLPGEITDFFFFDPLLGALTLSQALPSQAEVDARLAQLIHDWNIGYVILHRDMLEPGRVRAFGNLFDRQPMLERVGEEGPLVVYRQK